ncbi:MAG: hypothetical protein ACLGG0_01760 [Bacteriovoracia bacterium]
MRLILVLSVFLALPARAEPSLERLCFPSAIEAQKGQAIIQQILAKGVDIATLEANCVNVMIDENRVELLDRWVATRLPLAKKTFSASSAPRPECDLLVTKVSKKDEKNKQAGVRQNGFIVSVDSGDNENREENFIKVLSGGTAKLKVDESELEITCVVKGSNYHLKFAMLYVPRPLIPPTTQLPPGSVIVVNAPPPPDKSGSSLQTEVEAQKGQEINLGQITRDLRNKTKELDISPSVQMDSKTGTETTRWLLRVR